MDVLSVVPERTKTWDPTLANDPEEFAIQILFFLRMGNASRGDR